jgi:hypothetical protein
LRHAAGEDISHIELERGASGVMMIPIDREGVYEGVQGVEVARETPAITGIEITAKLGHALEPLPEGATYLGFIFARAERPEQVEQALRNAHAELQFQISPTLPVMR